MENGGGAVSGRRGDGASVCHLCGYAHPISELLAHSKICCKKISTATTEEGAGELGDTVLLLGGDKEEQGERTGSNAAECGCGLTASALEVGDAAQDGGNAEGEAMSSLIEHAIGAKVVSVGAAANFTENVDGRNETKGVDLTSHEINDMHIVNGQNDDIDAGFSSCEMSALQSTFAQDLSSHKMVVKNEEVTPETSTIDRDDTVTALAAQNSETEWPVEDGDPSCPAASSKQLQDVPSVLPAEPEDAVRFDSEIPEYDLFSDEIFAETSASTSSSTVHEGKILECFTMHLQTSRPQHQKGISAFPLSTGTLEHMWGRALLLETPTGFAMFIVKEPLEAETAWMHFMDIATAKKVVSLIGFVKLVDKSAAWGEGDGGPSKDLEHLIQKTLKDKKELLVDTKFKDVIKGKFGITCCDDDGIDGDLFWGLKNVLREFIHEEKHNITKEYYFPLSKGWKDVLLKFSISVPANVCCSYLMSKKFLLRSLVLTSERVSQNLRKSFDRHVNDIGNHIKDDFKYVLVLARILVPELTPNYNFSKMFSPDMVLKIEEAKRFASNYQEERLTLYDRQIILGALDQLGVVPGQIESAVAFIKLRLKEIEVGTRREQEILMTIRKDRHGERTMTIRKDGHGERTMQNEKRSAWHSGPVWIDASQASSCPGSHPGPRRLKLDAWEPRSRRARFPGNHPNRPSILGLLVLGSAVIQMVLSRH